MIRRPARSTRLYTLWPDTTVFRSAGLVQQGARQHQARQADGHLARAQIIDRHDQAGLRYGKGMARYRGRVYEGSKARPVVGAKKADAAVAGKASVAVFAVCDARSDEDTSELQ